MGHGGRGLADASVPSSPPGELMRLTSSIAMVLLTACSSSPASQSPDATMTGADAFVGNSTAPTVPQPTGTCPTITTGDVTFAPAGMPPRKVKLALDLSKAGHGELVFYWH